MSGLVSYTDSSRFEQDVLQSDLPVALDYYSEDCAPCAALAPIFDRMAERYGDRMKFVKILRQANRELAVSQGVTSSPTVLFFHKGKEVGKRLNGFIKKADLRQAIEEVLDIKPEAKEVPTIKGDVLILGAGVAGLTAAIYASRAKLDTLVIDEGVPGGQTATTFHLANYPGTAGDTSGKALMENMVEQATRFGAKIYDLQEVYQVEVMGDTKRVVTEEAIYEAPAIIIATGAQSRRLPAVGEEQLRGRGVHYCATCDGSMYAGAKVAVVGGGNSAVEEAVFLTRYATEVTIIHQFDHFQASPTAQAEALNHPKIKVIWDSEVREVKGESHLKSLVIENVKTGEKSELEVNGVFVYIGMQPRTDMLRGQLPFSPDGSIPGDNDMKTSLPGVFVAGDVRTKTVRQAITAAGDGAVAAVNAERYLHSLKRKG